MRIPFAIVVGLFVLTSPAGMSFAIEKADETADVYILSGQSNMQGIGRLAQLDAAEAKPAENVFFWNGKAFEPLVPGKTKTSDRPGEFGPEITFAKAIGEQSPKAPIYLIKLSLSGQPLHQGWDGAEWKGDNPGPGRKTFYPGESPKDPNTGVHYQKLRGTCAAALAALKKSGVKYTIRGFLWMQGEADSKNEISAKEYPASLKRLKRRLEEDVGTVSLPFVFGQVLPHEPALPRFTHRTEIRQSQANAHWASGHADAISNVWMVSTNDMPLLADTVHYDARGQALLGRAFAAAMIEAHKKASAETKK